MFNFETIIRTVAVLAGVLLILSQYVNFSYIMGKLLSAKNDKVVTPQPIGNDKFLQIIDLWYKLRSECVGLKLDSAIKKMDEVFPLLNDKPELIAITTPVLAAKTGV